jgi:hypothetical protein
MDIDSSITPMLRGVGTRASWRIRHRAGLFERAVTVGERVLTFDLRIVNPTEMRRQYVVPK